MEYKYDWTKFWLANGSCFTRPLHLYHMLLNHQLCLWRS